MFYNFNDPKIWYSSKASCSIELLGSYVDGIERIANQSVEDYRNLRITVPKDEGKEYESEVVIHRGIDDQSWNMDSVFIEYFPSLHRRSGVVILYSFLETELYKLCQQCKIQYSLKMNISDLSGTGIKRASNYLEKVVGLDLQRGSSGAWQEIMHIQKLRNILVHADGKVGSIDRSFDSYLKEVPEIDVTEEVIIKDGYLRQVLNIFHDFYRLIDSEIQKLPVKNDK